MNIAPYRAKLPDPPLPEKRHGGAFRTVPWETYPHPRGKNGLSGNFWLLSFKISYLCLPLFYETRTTPSCHPSGCAYRQL